jgi:hypothetical protein
MLRDAPWTVVAWRSVVWDDKVSFNCAVSCGTKSDASCLAAVFAISHAACFFKMKATARIAEVTGTGMFADI